MAIFCYKTSDGKIFERDFPVGKAPRTVRLSTGRIARRFLAAELTHQAHPSGKGWPLTCVASGVHPDQAGELRDHLADRGVPTEVTSDGDPVYRNAAHRRRALAARGIYDNNSFC